jgi:Tfp pilus assembly protein PilF
MMHMDSPLPSLPGRSTLLWFSFCIGAILTAVYGLSLSNGFVTFDDDILVFNNIKVQSFTLHSIAYVFTHFDPELYIPLTFITYQLNWLMGGGSPFLFHLTNLTLHFGNVLLIAWFLYLLSGKKWIAATCAVIFAVHPLNTEAVAWISARKDVLSAFFLLLSIIAYMYASDRNRKDLFWWSVSAFVLGLLSKVSIILLPFLLILIDIHKRRKYDKCMFMDKIPYLVAGLIFGIIALFGKQGSLAHESPMTYLLMAPKSIIHYLQTFLFPVHLSVVYPYTQTVSIESTDIFVPLIIFCVALIAAIIGSRHNKTILFGALFFLIMLLPSFANISKNGDLYVGSDRYAYVPMIGLLLIIATGIEQLCTGYGGERTKRSRIQMATTLIGIIAFFLAMGAFARSEVWTSTQTLFADAVLKAPSSHLAHNKLGSQLFDAGHIDEAEAEFRASLSLKETARVHYNLGLVYLEQNKLRDALKENELAVALEPNYAPAHVNLGYLLSIYGKIPEAISHFLIAIAHEENNVDARLNLAVLYTEQNNTADALKLIHEILTIDPQNPYAILYQKELTKP